MRYREFGNKESDIAFIKFMFDKAWHEVKTDLLKNKAININKLRIANNKVRNKYIKSLRNDFQIHSNSNIRPIR